MSTVSSGNGAKGEKGKKYQSLNINSLFKVSGSESQQKSAAPKHGLQVLGKVPAGRRVPNPVHLPSLKSESGGQDPNVVLVPANSSGWVSGSEGKNGSVPTGTGVNPNAAQLAPQPQPEVKTTQPLGSPVKQPPVLKPQVPQAPPTNAPSANRGPPVAIQPGQLRPGGGQLPASRPAGHYDRQFPTLGGGLESGKPVQDAGPDQKQGPSLRPQTEGTWTQGGRAPSVEQQRYPNLGPVPEPELGQQHPMAQGQGRPMPPMMHPYRGMPPPYMRPPPPGQFPPHFQMRNARPQMRGPPPQRGPPRQMSGEDFAPPPILKQEDFNKLDEIGREGGWANDQDEIDYNQKLTFSDDEEEIKGPKTLKDVEPKAKVERDSKWAESIQPQGKLIQQAKVQSAQVQATDRGDYRTSHNERAPLDDDDDLSERRRQQQDQESLTADRARHRRLEAEIDYQKKRNSVSSDGVSPRVSESRDYRPSDREYQRDYQGDAPRHDYGRLEAEPRDYPPRQETERDYPREHKDYPREGDREYRPRDGDKDYRPREGEGKNHRPREGDRLRDSRDYTHHQKDYGRRDETRRDEPREREFTRAGEPRRKEDWDRGEDHRDYGYAQPRGDGRNNYQRGYTASHLPPRLQRQQDMRRQDSGPISVPPAHGEKFVQPPPMTKVGRPTSSRPEHELNRDYDRDDRRPPSREQRLRRQDSDQEERRVKEKEEYERPRSDGGRWTEPRVDDRGYSRRNDEYDEYGRNRYSDADPKRDYDRDHRSADRDRLPPREISIEPRPENFESREPEEIASWADDADSPPPPPSFDDVRTHRRDDEIVGRPEEKSTSVEKEVISEPLKPEEKEQEALKVIPDEPPKPVRQNSEPAPPREPPKRAEVSREPRPKLVAAKEEPLPKGGEKKEVEEHVRPRTWAGHSYKEERKHKGHAPLPISRERVEADIDNVLKKSIASSKKGKEEAERTETIAVEEKLADTKTEEDEKEEKIVETSADVAQDSVAKADHQESAEEKVESRSEQKVIEIRVGEKADDKSAARGGRGRAREFDSRQKDNRSNEKDYRGNEQRGRGSRPYSQPSGRGRSDYRGGRGGRYYYDDWEGEYDYPKKREVKTESKDKPKVVKPEEKEVKDGDQKENVEAGIEKKEEVEQSREEGEQDRRGDSRGWGSSRGTDRRSGRGGNTRGRGSYGPPGSRPFSGEGEGSKEHRAPRFQKFDTSQRGRGLGGGRKGPNVPPPFSDKKEKPDEEDRAEKKPQDTKGIPDKVTKETEIEKSEQKELKENAEVKVKTEKSINEEVEEKKSTVQEEKVEQKKSEVVQKEYPRPQREKRERRDDRRRDDYRRDENRERRDRGENRETGRPEQNEGNKENTGSEPHGKKHKEWDPSLNEEEKAKKPRKEEKPSQQRPVRERRDSGRIGKTGYQRDVRHTTLPPRFAKLHAQRHKGFGDAPSPVGFGSPVQAQQGQSGGISKVDLNPPPPPPVNAWAKPITETLKQHAAAALQQVSPVVQTPPTSAPPLFALPQRRGEPVKVGQSVQQKSVEIIPEPTQITGSLVFENTKIKTKTEDQIEPIQLPFALSKPSEDLQLDFTFDASLQSEEKRVEPSAQSANPVGSKANVNLNLQRGIVSSVQSPISPSTVDLNLKIQSVKKVWDTMPTVTENSTEEPSASSNGPFGNAFGSPSSISAPAHSQISSEMVEPSPEEYGGNQNNYAGSSSPSGKVETTAPKGKQQPSPPPTFSQHYASVSSQQNVVNQYQQYNTVSAIPSPPATMLYNPTTAQQITGQQLLTQYQMDGGPTNISMLQIINAGNAPENRNPQYPTAQGYNLPGMSPNLSQFGSSGFSQPSMFVPPPSGAPPSGGGQQNQASAHEAMYGGSHVRVQPVSYGPTSPSPSTVLISGNKSNTAQYSIGVGAQQGFGTIGTKTFQQHPGPGSGQGQQTPFLFYEPNTLMNHMSQGYLAPQMLRNGTLPAGPPPSAPTSFYSAGTTSGQSPFFQGQANAQIQPPPSMNQNAGAFGSNASFLQGFPSQAASLQNYARNPNQMQATAAMQNSYRNLGLHSGLIYKIGLTNAPDQLKQMAALSSNDSLASQYMSSQGAMQLSANGSVQNSSGSGINPGGVQPPASSPKNKDQRGNGMNGNRYGNATGFGNQNQGSYKQSNTNVYSRPPMTNAYPQQQHQAQSRFPAPIQRPAVTQAGANQKSGKPMGGVSPSEGYSPQGNGVLNDKMTSDASQDLMSLSSNEETLKTQGAELQAESPTKLEINEVN